MELLDRSLEIRNATLEAENTAERVGGVLEDFSNLSGIADLITRSQAIRSETIADANTTERVGSLLEDLSTEFSIEFVGFSNFIRVGDITGTAHVFGEVLYRLARSVSPVPGSNGEITFTNITDSGFTANWAEAVDQNYTHAQLTYKVYSSDSANIDTVANAELNGTLETSATGITSYEFTGLQPESGKFVSVVVVNSDTVKALYPMVSEVTEPETISTTPSGTVTDTSLTEESQKFSVSFDDINVTDQDGYEVQFSDVGGTNATIHDIGNVTSAEIMKSVITSYAQTKTLEVKIRPYADEKGNWSKIVPIDTHTEGAKTATIQIETA